MNIFIIINESMFIMLLQNVSNLIVELPTYFYFIKFESFLHVIILSHLIYHKNYRFKSIKINKVMTYRLDNYWRTECLLNHFQPIFILFPKNRIKKNKINSISFRNIFCFLPKKYIFYSSNLYKLSKTLFLLIWF